jgi:hypothetical protein
MDHFELAAGRDRTVLDEPIRAVEIKGADAGEPRVDEGIGRISRKPRARDAVLNDVKCLDYNSRYAWSSVAFAEQLALHKFERCPPVLGLFAL